MNSSAAKSGKILSPREILLGLRRQLNTEQPIFCQPTDTEPILEVEVSAEAIQYCTTCIFDAPRNILTNIPRLKLIEIDRNREMAMCCGVGGELTWFDEVTMLMIVQSSEYMWITERNIIYPFMVKINYR